MKKLLHVGCGLSTIKDLPTIFQDGSWQEVRFDIDEEVNPDILGTLLDMEAVESGSVDAIYSSHNIEHVYYHEVLLVLKEFKRILTDDGLAIVACPDIGLICELALQDGLDAPLYQSSSGPITPLDIIYGHSASIKTGATYMAHKTGFDIKLLAKRFRQAGFGNLHGKRLKPRKELLFVASKRRVSDKEIIQKFDDFGKGRA